MFKLDFINIPLGYVMRFLANILGGNFAASVFLFTLLIDVILIPLSIKSQKSTVQQLRIKPKLDELKKRYGDDKQKMAQEQQALYQKEGVSMAGGCLPMLIRLVLLITIYSLILSPLTYMSGAKADDVKSVRSTMSSGMKALKEKDKDKYEEFAEKLSWTSSSEADSNDLGLMGVVKADDEDIKEAIGKKKFEKLEKPLGKIRTAYKNADVDYELIGINLTETPDFNIDIFHNFQRSWLMPIGAFIAQILMSVVSMKINKINNPDAPSMGLMLYLMPVVSLIIGFNFPCGVCFYWICSSIVGGAVQVLVQVAYGPQKVLAKERTKELLKECDFEKKQLEKFNGTEQDLF